MPDQLPILAPPPAHGRTRVYNVRMVQRTAEDVYVGRAGHGEDGRWGNPYGVREHGPDAAMGRYVRDLADGWRNGWWEFRRDALTLLAGRRLLCFCLQHEWDTSLPLPKRLCHGIPLALVTDLTRGLECPAAERWPELKEAAEHARWKEGLEHAR